MDRRSFLQLLAGSALLTVGTPRSALSAGAGGATAGPKLRRAEASELGVTLTFGLANAPFPCPGKPYTDDTVAVFVPALWRDARSGLLDVVVHFHGHYGTVDAALRTMRLREQLVASRRNALLVVPQGPVNAADGNPGKLSAPGGLRRLLDEVRHELQSDPARQALGPEAVVRSERTGNVILSAHSGGYGAAACSLAVGGLDVREVYLFDALYGRRRAFREWVLSGRTSPGAHHKLISTYTRGGGTLDENRALLAELRQAGVDALHQEVEDDLTSEQRARGDALFVLTRVAHGDAVWANNGLAACLRASCLARTAQPVS